MRIGLGENNFLEKFVPNSKKDSKQLKKIFEADQKDRSGDLDDVDPSKLKERDEVRKGKAKELLEKGVVTTGKDYYHAAMIFQHGSGVGDFKKAVSLAEKSMELGYEKAKWLYAAATDRKLMFEGKKQKFGTQYQFKEADQKWVLYPVDEQISDKTRSKYNVPSLQEMRKKIKKKNRQENS